VIQNALGEATEEEVLPLALTFTLALALALS
jgi:hypothetical protein